MSEAELQWLGLRLTGARIAKARRGALRLHAPTGYVWTEEGLAFDPDEAVRTAIETVFSRYAVLLKTCPGVGPIRAAQIVSVVVTPDRFRKRQQFWSYCGLGLVMRSSSDWVKSEKGTWARATINKTRGMRDERCAGPVSR